MQIIKRAAALKAGLKRYFTGKPCSRGHIAERKVNERMCVECLRLRGLKDRVMYADYYSQYRAQNRAKHLARNKRYYDENAQTFREYSKQYRSTNADAVRKKDRLRAQSASRIASHRKSRRKHLASILEKRRNNYLRNSERIKAAVKRYRDENPDKVREQRRPGVSAARARRQKAEGKFTKADVRALLAAQDSLCAACRIDIAAGFHVDHIVPLKRGGSNWPMNLQLLCQPCNLSKGTKTMEEWITWKTQLSSLARPQVPALAL